MAQEHSDNLDEIVEIEKILTDARFEFALKCLKTVMHLNENENVVFSPHTIYEGLLLVYLVSSDNTELNLRRKLELPDRNLQKNITEWITERKKEEKKLSDYNDKIICWITNTKNVKSMTQYLFKSELEVVGFHKANVNFENRINELLRIKTEGYIRQPVELNHIHEGMEIILSTLLCLKGDTIQNISTDEHEMQLVKEARTVVSNELNIYVTELPFLNKNLSLFLLFPLPQFLDSDEWPEYGKMSEMIDRLSTRKGIDELRRVLESSTEEWETEEVTYPDFFELENELDIEKLLDELGIQNLLKRDEATLSNFTDQQLQLGGAKHRAYIKVTHENVTAGAINMYFTKNEESFNSSQEINHSACKKKFLWLLYCRKSHTILFIGSINEEKPLSPTEERKGCFDKIRRCFN